MSCAPPLSALIVFTGMLLMGLPGPLTADRDAQLRTIQTSAKHLLSLINDLALAKIKSGQVELQFKPVDCQSVMEAGGPCATAADASPSRLHSIVPDIERILKEPST